MVYVHDKSIVFAKVNDVNQYSQRAVPGYAAMQGTANATSQVTLWRGT